MKFKIQLWVIFKITGSYGKIFATVECGPTGFCTADLQTPTITIANQATTVYGTFSNTAGDVVLEAHLPSGSSAFAEISVYW